MKNDNFVLFVFFKHQLDTIKITLLGISVICGAISFGSLVSGANHAVTNGFFYAWVFFGITILLLVINCFISTKDDLISMMNELSDDDGR